jgi:hypothetical protein
MRLVRLLLALSLVVAVACEDAPVPTPDPTPAPAPAPAAPQPVGEAVFWAMVSITDSAGVTKTEMLQLSQAGTSAPEFRAVQARVDEETKAAKAAWNERRKAWEADKANSGKPFRKVEPEPGKGTVKIVGKASKEKAKVEEAYAKIQQAELAKADPGLAFRKKVITERLLQHFTIGVEATPEWLNEVREKQGARFATNMAYLSYVVARAGDDGSETGFLKYPVLKTQLDGAQQAGVICWLTWYGLAQAPPANYLPTPAAATLVNAKNQATMLTYWTVLKKSLEMIAKYPELPVVLQVEPDEWGHLLLGTQWNPDLAGSVLVGGSGLPELKGLPDTIRGWTEGFRILRNRIAPNVILAANPSAWDRNGAMNGENWGKVFASMDITPKNGWDLFITQLHDWDKGLNSNGGNAKFPPYKPEDFLTYHGSVDSWLAWIEPIHKATGMWGVAWQLPVGNTTYAACDGSDGHGMDGIAELLLEGYPKNTTAARMAAAGCCMWIFSNGSDAATKVFDMKKDGITNPAARPGNKGLQSLFSDDDGGYLRLKAAEYFKDPVWILGKPAGKKPKR